MRKIPAKKANSTVPKSLALGPHNIFLSLKLKVLLGFKQKVHIPELSYSWKNKSGSTRGPQSAVPCVSRRTSGSGRKTQFGNRSLCLKDNNNKNDSAYHILARQRRGEGVPTTAEVGRVEIGDMEVEEKCRTYIGISSSRPSVTVYARESQTTVINTNLPAANSE